LIFAAPEATLGPQAGNRRLTEFARNQGSLGGLCVANQVHDLTPGEVSKGMAEGRYLLVDVREPNEVAVEASPDGLVIPLSTFDPTAIPDPQGREVVFACRSGKRSVTASLAAQAAGLPYDKHLAGGIIGWKAAGLPTKVGG
jgi:rhodanese-related sulfurtransferase